MQEVIKLRRVRTVTHYYITDTVALNPAEFYPLGAPQSEEAFLSWINAHLADLIANPDLSELTRLRLSKLDYYQEDRDRREDSLKMSKVGH